MVRSKAMPNISTASQALIVQAPSPLPFPTSRPTIFLAGTIDPDFNTSWRTILSKSLSPYPVTILNPQHWGSDWKEEVSCLPFKAQVEWELEALEKSTFIVVNFIPRSPAPITLLEMGLFTREKASRIIVCCPRDFYKRGNVQIVCERYGVMLVETLDELILAVQDKVGFEHKCE